MSKKTEEPDEPVQPTGPSDAAKELAKQLTEPARIVDNVNPQHHSYILTDRAVADWLLEQK